MYYIAKSVVASLPLGTDSEKEQHEQARVKATANLRRLDRLKDDSDSGNDSGRGADIPVGFDGAFPSESCLCIN